MGQGLTSIDCTQLLPNFSPDCGYFLSLLCAIWDFCSVPVGWDLPSLARTKSFQIRLSAYGSEAPLTLAPHPHPPLIKDDYNPGKKQTKIKRSM
jgi:hypothetical protein